ncbi:hypothetical protein GBAR_LOCUS21642 [Geodia barretti]|uniref:Uncharacterized protein n=1 Tax=Geodia barretti TaxID=519541 RepID=A0AA35X5F1_GEOBA|nr:hypothetical protein GBAR_LOCUS21642 [Geodia barretti]
MIWPPLSMSSYPALLQATAPPTHTLRNRGSSSNRKCCGNSSNKLLSLMMSGRDGHSSIFLQRGVDPPPGLVVPMEVAANFVEATMLPHVLYDTCLPFIALCQGVGHHHV